MIPPHAHLIAVRGIAGATTSHLFDAFGRQCQNAGIMFHPIEYPRTSAIRAASRTRTVRLAKRIADKSTEILEEYGIKPSVVAHSYGCLIAHRAPWHRCHLKNAYLLHPAVERGWAWLGYEKVFVFHDERDKTLSLGSLMPFHPFGKLGKLGHSIPGTAYATEDYVRNIPIKHPSEQHGRMCHSSWLKGLNAAYVAETIIKHELDG